MASRIVIRQYLGLPQNHHAEPILAGDGFEFFAIRNEAKVGYLLVGIGGSGKQVPNEQATLQAFNFVNTATTIVLLSDIGEYISTYRLNVRTRDLDNVARSNVRLKNQRLPLNGIQTGLTSKLEGVLFEVHSALRDIDGLHAPDALDEISKILYAKIFDEEDTILGQPSVFTFNFDSSEECAASVRDLYSRAVKDDLTTHTNRSVGYTRSRGVFNDPLFLSSAALARTVEILQPYSISRSPVDVRGRAFQNVLTPAMRSGMGQYFTPSEVIDFIVGSLRPTMRDKIIDPFCGSGHFLTTALDFVREHAPAESSKLLGQFAMTRLHGIEKSDRMVRIAMTDMRLHGDGHSNIRCTDALLPFDHYPDLAPESFDLVITNPPFGIDLPFEAAAQLGPFELADRKRKTISLEVVAIERCLQLLRPGGRLAIILPDGILGNSNEGTTRDWILTKARIEAIVSLPVATFSPFGASVKTSILFLRKRDGTAYASDAPVFLAEISDVGFDAVGRSTGSLELVNAGEKLADFLQSQGV